MILFRVLSLWGLAIFWVGSQWMVCDKCCCCEWAVIASYHRDNRCPLSSSAHLVWPVEGVVSAVLVQSPVRGGAQVSGQVEIVIELALAPRHTPPAWHAVRVQGGGVALTPAPGKARNVDNQSLCMLASCHEGWWSKVLNNYGIKTWLQSFFGARIMLLTVAKQSPQCADLLLDYFRPKENTRRRMKFNLQADFLKPRDIDNITFSRRGRWWCMRQGWSDRRQPLSQT